MKPAGDPLQLEHTKDAIARRLAAAKNHSYFGDFILGAVDGTVTTFAIVDGGRKFPSRACLPPSPWRAALATLIAFVLIGLVPRFLRLGSSADELSISVCWHQASRRF